MSGREWLKFAYRVFRWSSLVLLVLTLFLVLRKSAPPDVPYDPDASQRVQQEFAAADLARSAGEQAKVQLDRTELNSYLHDSLELEGKPSSQAQDGADPPANPEGSERQPLSPVASNPASQVSGADPQTIEQVQSSVKDVQIDMSGDLITAYVIFDFHGKDLSLQLQGHLRTEDGYLRFEPVAGSLGSLPLPQSTLDSAVSRLMSSPENREKFKLPPDVADVRIQDGQAVITYR